MMSNIVPSILGFHSSFSGTLDREVLRQRQDRDSLRELSNRKSEHGLAIISIDVRDPIPPLYLTANAEHSIRLNQSSIRN